MRGHATLPAVDPLAPPLPARGPSVALRVVSLNVWGLFDDWAWRMAHLAHLLARCEADVIGLQEVCRTETHDECALLCPPGWAYLRADSPREDCREGVALCTPWPVVGEAAGILADSRPDRPIIQARLSVAGRPCSVTVTHTAPAPESVCARHVAQSLAFMGPEAAVLLGDLNALPATVRPLADARGVADTLGWSQAPTWPTVPGPRLAAAWSARVGTAIGSPRPCRLDYILTRDLVTEAAGTLTPAWAGFPAASDHSLVWADLAYAT